MPLLQAKYFVDGWMELYFHFYCSFTPDSLFNYRDTLTTQLKRAPAENVLFAC